MLVGLMPDSQLVNPSKQNVHDAKHTRIHCSIIATFWLRDSPKVLVNPALPTDNFRLQEYPYLFSAFSCQQVLIMTDSPYKSNRTLVPLLSFFLLLANVCTASAGTITWNVTYNDIVNSTNVGFADPTLGATRRATFQAVLDYVGSVLDASGSVDFVVNDSQLDGSGFLASAGTYFSTSPARFDSGYLFKHATTGTDPNGTVGDAYATFDFGYNWNSDTGSVAAGEYDLYSVALHEIGHALGFLSLVKSDGTSGISSGDPGVFSVYDSFLERSDGTPLFGAGGDFLGSAADLTSNAVFFTGANAVAANGGNPVKVYAPSTYADGSSISHVDDGVTSVMNYSIASNVEKRTFSAIDLGILQDIGWTLQTTSVPEPASTGLLLAITTGLLAARWRRKKSAED